MMGGGRSCKVDQNGGREGGWITNLTAKERIWIFKIKKKKKRAPSRLWQCQVCLLFLNGVLKKSWMCCESLILLQNPPRKENLLV